MARIRPSAAAYVFTACDRLRNRDRSGCCSTSAIIQQGLRSSPPMSPQRQVKMVLNLKALRNYVVSHEETLSKRQQCGREYFAEFIGAAGVGRDELAIEDLFNLCLFLSRSGYELRPVCGSIVIRDSDEESSALAVALVSPIACIDHYGARKLVLSSSKEFPAACDGAWFFGLFPEDQSQVNYTIRFQKNGVWELLIDNHIYGAFRDDTPICHDQVLREDAFYRFLIGNLGTIPDLSFNRIWRIVCEAARQPYGANLLITSAAAEEAQRLSSHDTRVSPVALTPSLVAHLSRLDGTVIIDQHGFCHAIGAILDGRANASGNFRRGARYNTAIMYAGSSRAPCAIVVVSQEGFLDLVSSASASGSHTTGRSYLCIDSGAAGS